MSDTLALSLVLLFIVQIGILFELRRFRKRLDHPVAPACQHFWEEYESASIRGRLGIRSNQFGLVGKHYIMRCKHCGDLKDHVVEIQ